MSSYFQVLQIASRRLSYVPSTAEETSYIWFHALSLHQHSLKSMQIIQYCTPTAVEQSKKGSTNVRRDSPLLEYGEVKKLCLYGYLGKRRYIYIYEGGYLNISQLV